MDTQAKDRLTGAVILVALVVLLVPELLSGPGAKRVNVAATPAEGQPLRSYTVELGDEARAHGAVAASAASAALVAPPGAPAANSPPPPPSPAPPAQATVAEKAAPHVSAAPEIHPGGVSHPPAAPVLQPTPVTGWIIQLGSFASRANAERLVRELKGKGYAASMTESGNGGRKLYRVRVGPTLDHATAQTLAAKLRAAGHPGSLAPHP